MCAESNMQTCITICHIERQRELGVCLRELRQGLCVNPEGVGWGGRWEGGSKGRGCMHTCG